MQSLVFGGSLYPKARYKGAATEYKYQVCEGREKGRPRGALLLWIQSFYEGCFTLTWRLFPAPLKSQCMKEWLHCKAALLHGEVTSSPPPRVNS